MNKRLFLQSLLSSALASTLPMAFAQGTPEPRKLMLQGSDATGKQIKLSDYLGKTVLVSFYTAGCNLCTRDLKLMREFYGDNMKKNFVLLAVNIDQDKKDFDDYTKLINITIPKERRYPSVWRNAPDHSDNFGTISHQPTHFVINTKNEFVLKREGTFLPSDWDNLWELLG